MTFLDYFVLIVVISSVALGAAKGILRGFLSIIFAVLGVIAAARLYAPAARLFIGFTSGERAANLFGFVAVFLLVLIAGGLLSRWLRGALRRSRLDWVDHTLGTAFGLARGWLVCSALYLALTAFPVRPGAVESATFAPALLEGTRVIAYITSPEVREKFLKGYETVQGLWKQRK